MSHVFISYVHENKKEVDELCLALRKHGINVWLDREQIQPGQRWQTAIREAIQQGSFYISCFSREYSEKARSYMNEELTVAIEELRRRPVSRAWFIPVRLSECAIPNRPIGAGETLQNIQWLNLFSDWDEGVRKIVTLLQSEESAEFPMHRSPRGLNMPLGLENRHDSHQEKVAEDRETERLLAALRQAAAEWDCGGRSTDYLLYGDRLALMEKLLKGQPRGSGRVEEQFLEAGVAFRRLRTQKIRRRVGAISAMALLAVLLAGYLVASWMTSERLREDQLVGSAWERGRSLQAQDKYVGAIHSITEAVLAERDEERRGNILIDFSSFKPKWTLTHILQHDRQSFGMNRNNPSDRLLTWGGGTARLWDLGTGKLVAELQHRNSEGGTLRYVNDGYALTLSREGTRWNPSGSRLLTWSESAASIWDAGTGALLARMQHRDTVNGANWELETVTSPFRWFSS